MKHPIDIINWKRKEHYEFFSSLDDPFYGFTVNVDCTKTYNDSKASGKSFFLLSTHRILKAINSVEEFRYRIEDGGVVCYDKIHIGSTIGRDDETFGFGFFEFIEDEDLYIEGARKEIERIQNIKGLARCGNELRVDLVRFSPVPWLAFTDMKHAGNMRSADSATKISTGKVCDNGIGKYMAVSVTAHHGLTDGIHAAKFIKALEQIL